MNADVQPFAGYRQRIFSRATDFYLTYDQAGMSLDSAELFHDVYYHSRPDPWYAATGYADPALDALIDKIDGEVSKPNRDALIEQAWRTVLNEIVVTPLYHPVAVWAMRDSLDVPSHALPWPIFFQARLTAQR